MTLPPAEGERVPVRRADAPGPWGGGVYLPRVQQTRLLDAAVEVVAELGVKRLSASRVSGRAGMSTKTFYDLFADGEDCFLAVFDRAVAELAGIVAPAWAGEDEWVERVRAGLIVFLASLERDPALAKVVLVEALGAGPRVLERRAEVLDRVARFVDEGRAGSPLADALPSLVAEGVVGAAFSIVHARLVEQRPDSLMELVGPVVATVVLPYRGQEASARELARPVPALPELPEPTEWPGDFGDDSTGSQAGGASRSRTQGATCALHTSWPKRGFERSECLPASVGRRDAPPIAPVKLTERTCAVLAAVGERPGANNRLLAAGSGASEPQISRLLARLAEHGLVENRDGGRGAHAKAWWLTASGAEFLRTGRPLPSAEPATGKAGRGKARKSSSARTGRIDPLDIVAYQRSRLLRAAAVAVDEHGYGAVTVAHIAARAKVSRRTFYELFDGREQCLLAVMQDIDAQVMAELRAADLGGLAWRERVRMGLWTVLRFFDREPVLARFCIVESARGEERMAAYRAQLLERITAVIAEGCKYGALGESSPLVAQGIAGGLVSILATRLSAPSGAGRRAARGARKGAPAGGPLSDLHGELMELIVLSYAGFGLAHLERDRPAPNDPAPASLPLPAPDGNQGAKHLGLDPRQPRVPGLRMTYRTALVLEAIAQAPGISNLDVAHQAGINDQGQISKLLARLHRHGLLQNTAAGQGQGAPNQWRLTPAGQELERGIRDHQKQEAA